jgi:hypothetical protein
MFSTLLSVLISTVAAAVVGVKLLVLAKRTRQLPETSCGVGLVAFALSQVGAILIAGLRDASPELAQMLRVFTLANLTIASAGLSLFTMETFGRTATRWLLATAIVVTGASLRLAILHQDIPIMGTGRTNSALPSLAALTFSLGFLWLGIEGLRYQRRARRAQAIGLASAQVVSRFLVMGIGGLAAGVFATLTAAANLTHGPLADLRGLFVCASGVVTAGMVVLAFSPPAAYRRFVEARAARSVPRHG